MLQNLSIKKLNVVNPTKQAKRPVKENTRYTHTARTDPCVIV